MINATFIFMMRQFFINFPKELEEAAELDGLGRLGIFFRIVLPLARPALAAQAIFVFMGSWNDFMRPLCPIRNCLRCRSGLTASKGNTSATGTTLWLHRWCLRCQCWSFMRFSTVISSKAFRLLEENNDTGRKKRASSAGHLKKRDALHLYFEGSIHLLRIFLSHVCRENGDDKGMVNTST